MLSFQREIILERKILRENNLIFLSNITLDERGPEGLNWERETTIMSITLLPRY